MIIEPLELMYTRNPNYKYTEIYSTEKDEWHLFRYEEGKGCFAPIIWYKKLDVYDRDEDWKRFTRGVYTDLIYDEIKKS